MPSVHSSARFYVRGAKEVIWLPSHSNWQDGCSNSAGEHVSAGCSHRQPGGSSRTAFICSLKHRGRTRPPANPQGLCPTLLPSRSLGDVLTMLRARRCLSRTTGAQLPWQ